MPQFMYILGESNLKFFQTLLSKPEFEIDEEKDPPEFKLAKLKSRLDWLQVLSEGMHQVWWKALEEYLLGEVEQIDHVLIWDAYYSGNEPEMRKLAVKRTGIVAIFESLHNVDQQIEVVAREIGNTAAEMNPPA